MLGRTILPLLFSTAALAGVLNPRASIWQPKVGSTFQMILSQTVSTSSGSLAPDSAEIWDIDLFYTSAETIRALQSRGKKVMCYFSAGTYEEGRPDSANFPQDSLGSSLPQWPGEKWLDLKNDGVWQVIKKRIALAASKKCDAIDPDNMDGYSNDNAGGLGLTQQDSINFLTKMANEAHSYGIAIGLKNSEQILDRVQNIVEFAVNEECVGVGDCSVYNSFLSSGKPVLHVEYDDTSTAVDISRTCSVNSRMSSVLKHLSLDGWIQFCDGSTANTPTSGGISEP